MGTSPYDDVPPQSRWSRVAADVAEGRVDAQGDVRFTIGPTEVIASAGSCFAGRLAEYLREDGFRYLQAERAPRWLTAEQQFAYGYRPFSARYGLVFTASQLLQLVERAQGRFVPAETAWKHGERFLDPFRPRTSPDGYDTIAELEADREQHFAAVRHIFERADVFFFTVGLTECWLDRRDGAVFPYCPGTAGGTFDESRYVFHNFTVTETVDAMERLLALIRASNPRIRVILSVSPVPIGATMERGHVARASTYTKSVLRVAVEEVVRNHDFVDYFAAYEMVAQSFFGSDPFTDDRRHLKSGVAERVVRAFRTSYLPESDQKPEPHGESIVMKDERPCDEDILFR